MTTIGNGLEFNAEKHIYTINGVRVPSVTEIVGMISGLKFAERTPVIEAAAERGTAVHELCEQYDFDELPDEIDQDLAMYLMAYIRFCKDYNVTWEYIELPLGSENHGFAGTIDRVGIIDGKRLIVDLKTTSNMDKISKIMLSLQLAAYSWLCNANDIRQPDNYCIPVADCIGVQLMADGNYKVHRVEDIIRKYKIEPITMFLKLLSVRRQLYADKE